MRNSGVSDVKQHSRTASHSNNEELMKGQGAFISDSFQLSSKSTISLSHQELVFQAGIVEA